MRFITIPEKYRPKYLEYRYVSTISANIYVDVAVQYFHANKCLFVEKITEMDIMIANAEDLEMYELCHNILELKNEILKQIKI